MPRSEKSSSSEQVIHQRKPSARARFTQPVVMKQGSLFLLSTPEGDIKPGTEQGLYFHDMRYLSRQTLRLNGKPPVSLLADASEGYRARFELTNPDLPGKQGSKPIRKESLGIHREKQLGEEFVETIVLQNYTTETAEVALQLDYAADFADMFAVRGMRPGKRGQVCPPAWHGSELRFQYGGADGHVRTAAFRFSPPPDEHDQGEITYRLSLGPQERRELTTRCALRDDNRHKQDARPDQGESSRPEDRQRARSGAFGAGTRVETSNRLVNDILTRSFMDLHMLRMRERGQTFFAAGVPWYVALFGRDSLVTALEVAAFEPEIAAGTLRVLAAFQGTKVDNFRDEQPGKIPHEFRLDEMANLNEIPQTPYYGSVDSTPLFLVLLGVHANWTGKLDLFHELRDKVLRALEWIDRYGDSDGDGFIDYQTRSPKGGRNQGWKDSGNGIVMEDGSLARPPIALPEVQGDVYRAWLSMADLFERSGDGGRAGVLRDKAQRLYEAFNREFWLEDAQYYAFCRDGEGRFSRSIASNAAHALWTGIVDPRRGKAVGARVMQPDMFSGWGVRTLSSTDTSYNPVDYQVGSVWPHDNGLIVAGMRRYGLDDEVSDVFTALMQAATQFEHYRLPEVFAGYERGRASRPVLYPVACNPQAWAAGSMPLMLSAALGFEPDAFNRRLCIAHPRLPDWLEWVNVQGLRVADATVDLCYERSNGATHVRVSRLQGDLQIDAGG